MKDEPKRPYIFAKQGYFWIYRWLPKLDQLHPGKGHKTPTGIPLDIQPPPVAPRDWWTVSKYSINIRELIAKLKRDNPKGKRFVVIPEGKKFAVRFYIGQSGNPVHHETDYLIDVMTPDELRDWYKESKHYRKLKEQLGEAVMDRFAYSQGRSIPKQVKIPKVYLSDVMKEMTLENEADRGKYSESILKSRRRTVEVMMEFDPSVTLHSADKLWMGRFRVHLVDKGYKSSTIQTFFRDIKALFAFAEEKKYITENPTKRIHIQVEQKLAIHTPFEEEIKLFQYLYRTDIEFFRQALFLRLTGIRVSDVVRIELQGFKYSEGLMDFFNFKKKRWEKFPISEAMRILLTNIPTDHAPHAFKIRSEDSYRSTLKDGCEAASIQVFATHQLKRNYTREIEEVEVLQHIFEMLKHHRAKGVTFSYTGRNLSLMKSTLDKAQAHWIDFLRSLPEFSSQSFTLTQSDHSFTAPRAVNY